MSQLDRAKNNTQETQAGRKAAVLQRSLYLHRAATVATSRVQAEPWLAERKNEAGGSCQGQEGGLQSRCPAQRRGSQSLTLIEALSCVDRVPTSGREAEPEPGPGPGGSSGSLCGYGNVG